jgi:hypothetical protein
MNRLFYSVLFCLLCIRAPVFSLPQPEADWLHVGISISSPNGLKNDPPLKFSSKDARTISQVWQSPGIIPKKLIFQLQPRSVSELEKSLDKITSELAVLNTKKLFLHFYYSGHGSPSGFHIANEQISFENIQNLLPRSVFSARLFILDVCYGASFFKEKGFKTVQPLQLDMQLDAHTEGDIIITSSAANEQSFESSSLGGSIFTTHWVMGLRGAADQNSNGNVSLFEAYNYAYERTVVYSKSNMAKAQHPNFKFDLQGKQDIPLSRPGKYKSGLLFDKCIPGRYHLVREPEKSLMGEVFLPRDGNFTLALQPGSYSLFRELKGENIKVARFQLKNDVQVVRNNHFESIKSSDEPFHAKGFRLLEPEKSSGEWRAGLRSTLFSNEALFASLSKETHWSQAEANSESFYIQPEYELQYLHKFQNDILSGFAFKFSQKQLFSSVEFQDPAIRDSSFSRIYLEQKLDLTHSFFSLLLGYRTSRLSIMGEAGYHSQNIYSEKYYYRSVFNEDQQDFTSFESTDFFWGINSLYQIFRWKNLSLTLSADFRYSSCFLERLEPASSSYKILSAGIMLGYHND